MKLNDRARRVCQALLDDSCRHGVKVLQTPGNACLIDCGVQCDGSLEAGRVMAETCLAGLGQVAIGSGPAHVWDGPWVHVQTAQPLAACMAAQYAGWQIANDGYFAMGSGPMRAARGREPLFERIGHLEDAEQVVGLLESSALPDGDTCSYIAEQCGVSPLEVTLLVAPTASLAGAVQVVARSVETALHKMFELEFDLHQVVAGFGAAPLPPVAGDDLAGIGRTNDAVLYGGHVTLWVRSEDALLQRLVSHIPSCASADHGQPFAEIFARYDRDFYKIDPLLFSPAQITLVNLQTGKSFRHGQVMPDVLQHSFNS